MIIIILAVVTAGSITALFVRGFKFQDLKDQFKNQTLNTPSMEVWLLETKGYDSKMEAYKAGIAAASHGFGVYVFPSNEKWTWVAGAYATEADANDAIAQHALPTDAQNRLYQIVGKSFQIAPDAIKPCNQVLTAVKNIFDLLLNLRTAINEATDTANLLLDLTTQYNQIKSAVETLQTLNAGLQNQLIATMIYTANQNILSLQEIIRGDTTQPCSLATVNTALLKTIFSLDNF